jgi:hypothetical protein
MMSKEDPTLRDYFASAAVQGLLARDDHWHNPWDIARDAYKIADAMMDVREERTEREDD